MVNDERIDDLRLWFLIFDILSSDHRIPTEDKTYPEQEANTTTEQLTVEEPTNNYDSTINDWNHRKNKFMNNCHIALPYAMLLNITLHYRQIYLN